jgi:hypothetical protein
MGWWRDARFGMFIHWGLYAVPAGTWHGERVDGLGEWIMRQARIPAAEYATLAKQFNPVQFDADAWVKTAKDAGMKYIIITSKHHDGFANFDSKVSTCGTSTRRRTTRTRSRRRQRGAPGGLASAFTTRSWTGITRMRSQGVSGLQLGSFHSPNSCGTWRRT